LDLLFHHLHVDLLHVHLLIELGRELGAPEELRVDAGSHGSRSGVSKARKWRLPVLFLLTTAEWKEREEEKDDVGLHVLS
jgi:hypothetical protein